MVSPGDEEPVSLTCDIRLRWIRSKYRRLTTRMQHPAPRTISMALQLRAKQRLIQREQPRRHDLLLTIPLSIPQPSRHLLQGARVRAKALLEEIVGAMLLAHGGEAQGEEALAQAVVGLGVGVHGGEGGAEGDLEDARGEGARVGEVGGPEGGDEAVGDGGVGEGAGVGRVDVVCVLLLE